MRLMLDQKRTRILIGLVAVVAVWVLLDLMFPWESTTLTNVLAQMSFFAIVACTIGGYIATENFVLPATILAVFVWFSVTAYSFFIGAEFGDASFERLVWNLPNAVLIPAAAVGAKLGIAVAAQRGKSASA